MNGGFSAALWAGTGDLYAAVLEHPFLTGLADGSLDPGAFGFYVTQDALYLEQYARALAGLAVRAPRDRDVEMFARHAAEAIAVERGLHETLLGELGLDPGRVRETPLAPTNLAYTSYLLATVTTGSFAAGLGAVLPCYWVYWEVGKELVRRGSPDPRYQRWVDTYGGAEFGAVVQQVLDVADRIGPRLSADEVAAAHAAFRTTTRYEWMFWDMGWRQESWPL